MSDVNTKRKFYGTLFCPHCERWIFLEVVKEANQERKRRNGLKELLINMARDNLVNILKPRDKDITETKRGGV